MKILQEEEALTWSVFSLLFLSYHSGTSEVYTLYIYTLSGNVHSNTVMFLTQGGDGGEGREWS